jgi:hypothetical protein
MRLLAVFTLIYVARVWADGGGDTTGVADVAGLSAPNSTA